MGDIISSLGRPTYVRVDPKSYPCDTTDTKIHSAEILSQIPRVFSFTFQVEIMLPDIRLSNYK